MDPVTEHMQRTGKTPLDAVTFSDLLQLATDTAEQPAPAAAPAAVPAAAPAA